MRKREKTFIIKSKQRFKLYTFHAAKTQTSKGALLAWSVLARYQQFVARVFKGSRSSPTLLFVHAMC